MYPSFARLGASRPPQHVQVETPCRRVGEPHRTAVWLKDGVRILERVNFGKKITGGVKIIRAQDYAGVDKGEAQLIHLACSKAPDGRQRWTLELLADRMVKLEYVEHISPETVRQALKKTN